MTKVSKQKKEKTERWEKIIRIGDKSTSISVEKISNGYLITKTVENYGKKYEFKQSKFFSKTNPLESEPYTKENETKEALKSIFDELGSIID